MEKLIRFDWAIKKILRNKANFDILEGFLTALLHDEISIVNILESESNQEDEADKFNRVDLLVENSQHQLIIIEVQVKSEQDFFHRIAYGAAKLLTEYLEKGQAYRQIKKIISINITYFDLGSGPDYLYYGSTHFVGVHDQSILKLTPYQNQLFGIQAVNKIFPEYYLIRIGEFTDQIHEAIDEWIYLLKHSEVKPEFQSKNIQQAEEKLRVMNLPEGQRKAYDRFMDNLSYQASMVWSHQQEVRLEGIQEGLQKGRQEGLQEGLQKGIQEGLEKGLQKGIQEGLEKGMQEEKITMVKNSLQQGLDLTIIASITGLTLEEIQKIQESLSI